MYEAVLAKRQKLMVELAEEGDGDDVQQPDDGEDEREVDVQLALPNPHEMHSYCKLLLSM